MAALGAEFEYMISAPKIIWLKHKYLLPVSLQTNQRNFFKGACSDHRNCFSVDPEIGSQWIKTIRMEVFISYELSTVDSKNGSFHKFAVDSKHGIKVTVDSKNGNILDPGFLRL